MYERFSELKKAAEDFRENYSLAVDCFQNLQQQYILENNFIKEKTSMISSSMLNDFKIQVERLQNFGEILRDAFAGLSDDIEIRQFVDIKTESMRYLLSEVY
jgi:hypothetical protein